MSEQSQEICEGPILPDYLKEELKSFEKFLSQIGFKRIEGAVYGLLVLSERPLRSEEIESALGLSQSAVSLAIKNLGHFGAVESYDSREGRYKLHVAQEDSLSIAATVFKKRESQVIGNFNRMAKRLLALSLKNGNDSSHPRVKRLQSIVLTATLAEAVMNFVMTITELDIKRFYPEIIKKLTGFMDALTMTAEGVDHFAQNFPDGIKAKLLQGLANLTNQPLNKKNTQGDLWS